MAKVKTGFILVRDNDDGNEVIEGYYSKLADAKEDAEPGDEIYEVSANWEVEKKVDIKKKNLNDTFGESDEDDD